LPFLGNDSTSSSNAKSLYINTDTYRKSDNNSNSKKRASLLSQESDNLNTDTFTKSTKPKRVESLIKRFDMTFWRRNKDPKEPSPSPSGSNSTDSMKRSKNLFNLISGNKKSTRDVAVECKMDDECSEDYYSGMGTRKSSVQSLLTKSRPLKTSQRHENGSNQRLTSIMKTTAKPREAASYESVRKASAPAAAAPIRVEILRNANRYQSPLQKPIGIASPLPQTKTRLPPSSSASTALKTGTLRTSEKKYEPTRTYVTAAKEPTNFRRDGSDRMSFRDYREKLKVKTENRKITDTSDDDLRKSYQQSFFIPA